MSRDEVERLLRDALAVEPAVDQVARLDRYYRRQTLSARRCRVWRTFAVAAAVLIAASLGLWSGWHALDDGAVDRQMVENEPSRAMQRKQNDSEGAHQQVALAPQPESGQAVSSAGRPATAYEQLLFYSRRSVPRMAPGAGQGGDVDVLIAQFADDETVTAEQIAAAAGLTADATQRLLVRHLFRANDHQKPALLRLLAVCGTDKSTPALLRLARREEYRTAALAAVERIVGVENLARQLDQTSDRQVRAAVMRRLLVADSPAGLSAYLALVNDPITRAEALAAADQMNDLPLSRLFDQLDDAQRTTRMSAALVLGHVNGPEVTEALIERVSRQPAGGVEAWIALLACRGAAAQGFVSFASTRPKLLAHVNHAQAEWLRLVQ